MIGTIIKGIGGFYYIKASENIYECKARGIFRKEKITPMIGDRVEIKTDGEKGSITKILERSSVLARPPVANVDTMLLVVAAASPEPNLQLIDKMLVNAELNNIQPAICVNKTDLAKRDDITKTYTRAGYTVFNVSAENSTGIGELSEFLKQKTTAFAGLSGVGKSTLLNLITGVRMETGSVSEKIMRGKHTTRHVELFELPSGGFVLDTPGFSSLEVEGVNAEDLWHMFPEMALITEQCRFRGCVHINEPDCRVKELVETGKMALSRYESYKQMYNKLKTVKEWEKK